MAPARTPTTTAGRRHVRTPALAATGALLLAALAAGAPSLARAQPFVGQPLHAPFFVSGTHSNDVCTRGFMSGGRAYRDALSQARCPSPCVAVHWVTPVSDTPCVLGYEVELVSAEDGSTVTRKARPSDSSLVVTGLKPTHNYKVTVTTRYSPTGTSSNSFEAMSSSD